MSIKCWTPESQVCEDSPLISYAQKVSRHPKQKLYKNLSANLIEILPKLFKVPPQISKSVKMNLFKPATASKLQPLRANPYLQNRISEKSKTREANINRIGYRSKDTLHMKFINVAPFNSGVKVKKRNFGKIRFASLSSSFIAQGKNDLNNLD